MSKLTEEEKVELEKELIVCRTNLRAINADLRELNELKQAYWEQSIRWESRFTTIDHKLALDSKLVVIKRGIISQENTISKSVLKDKKKLKELIELLKEEMESK